MRTGRRLTCCADMLLAATSLFTLQRGQTCHVDANGVHKRVWCTTCMRSSVRAGNSVIERSYGWTETVGTHQAPTRRRAARLDEGRCQRIDAVMKHVCCFQVFINVATIIIKPVEPFHATLGRWRGCFGRRWADAAVAVRAWKYYIT